MKKLVLASSNPGKLREFRQMLEPLGIEVVPQADLGIPDAEEPHDTFVENALAKARHAAVRSRLPAMADDSGICVSALAGAPGVRSARYSDEDGPAADREQQDQRNNAKLIASLKEKRDRRAHYVCVIVVVRGPVDPQPLIAEGTWNGEIIDRPRGENGFGYDPYFLLPDLGLTAAELPPEQKNVVSHRGKALRRLIARLRDAGLEEQRLSP
jgi:XTP/dITP diphosphohydrolase